ncbi:hypothetical protein M3Y96_00541800 [Aphelenchoides besseyi]|nr:hypothetical protein M3Y96_00541800 [Aphelenchoides besseyi]
MNILLKFTLILFSLHFTASQPTTTTSESKSQESFQLSSILFPATDTLVLWCCTCDSNSPQVSGNCSDAPIVPCREIEQSCVKIVKGNHIMMGCLMDESGQPVRMDDHCYTDIKRRRTCICNRNACNEANNWRKGTKHQKEESK